MNIEHLIHPQHEQIANAFISYLHYQNSVHPDINIHTYNLIENTRNYFEPNNSEEIDSEEYNTWLETDQELEIRSAFGTEVVVLMRGNDFSQITNLFERVDFMATKLGGTHVIDELEGTFSELHNQLYAFNPSLPRYLVEKLYRFGITPPTNQ